jgi:Uma2 family endonuclease
MSVRADGDARLTWEEFLRFQQAYDGPERFIWNEGHVVQVMTGGTERHDLVVMALVRQLDALLTGRPCHVFAHNRQIKTAQRSYYPDVLVRCGRAADPLYETDARLVIEVISPSNSPAERTRMLFDYQTLPSIEAIIFVDTRRRIATIHEKSAAGWTEGERRSGTIGDLAIDLDRMWFDVDEASSFD